MGASVFEATLPDAPKPLLDQAAVGTRVAADLVVWQLLVERPEGALLDPPVERLGERGCLFGGHSLNIEGDGAASTGRDGAPCYQRGDLPGGDRKRVV